MVTPLLGRESIFNKAREIVLCLMLSCDLTMSTNTVNALISCSCRDCVRMFSEKIASAQPLPDAESNCIRWPFDFNNFCILEFKMTLDILEFVSRRLAPL